MTLTTCRRTCHPAARHAWHHPAIGPVLHHTPHAAVLACCAGAAWLALPHLAVVPPPVPVAAPPAFQHAGLGAWYAPPGGYDLTQVPLAGFGGTYGGAGAVELPAVADLGSLPVPLAASEGGYLMAAYGDSTSTYNAPPSFVPAPLPTPVPEPSGLAVVALTVAVMFVIKRKA